jgi:hypothetical protein
MRRMPPATQRRNSAYLNRLISRFGRDKPPPGRLGTANCPGLAIDLGCLVDGRFRPDEVGSAYLDVPRIRLRRVNEGKPRPLRLVDLCVLTVELSGAHADV